MIPHLDSWALHCGISRASLEVGAALVHSLHDAAADLVNASPLGIPRNG